MNASPDTLRLDLPATPRYLNVLGDCIAALLTHVDTMNDPQPTTYNIQLAVHEACTNIIDHAYGGRGGRINISMTLQWEPSRLVVELTDSGKQFNPASIPDADLDQPHVRGYGLYLIKQLMDEVVYTPIPGGNSWRLVKNL